MKDRPHDPGRETPRRGDNKPRVSESERDASARADTTTGGTPPAGSARADAKTTQAGTGDVMRDKKVSAFSPEPPPQESLRNPSNARRNASNVNRIGADASRDGQRSIGSPNDTTGVNSARMGSEERTQPNNTPPGTDGARWGEHRNETEHSAHGGARHSSNSNHSSVFGRIKRFVSDRLHTR